VSSQGAGPSSQDAWSTAPALSGSVRVPFRNPILAARGPFLKNDGSATAVALMLFLQFCHNMASLRHFFVDKNFRTSKEGGNNQCEKEARAC